MSNHTLCTISCWRVVVYPGLLRFLSFSFSLLMLLDNAVSKRFPRRNHMIECLQTRTTKMHRVGFNLLGHNFKTSYKRFRATLLL